MNTIEEAVKEWVSGIKYDFIGGIDDLESVVLDGSFDIKKLSQIIHRKILEQDIKELEVMIWPEHFPLKDFHLAQNELPETLIEKKRQQLKELTAKAE